MVQGYQRVNTAQLQIKIGLGVSRWCLQSPLEQVLEQGVELCGTCQNGEIACGPIVRDTAVPTMHCKADLHEKATLALGQLSLIRFLSQAQLVQVGAAESPFPHQAEPCS